LQDNKLFLVCFAVVGFATKIVAEFVHEVCGHGLFVLLFGGSIINVYISIWWPYEFSYIEWVGNNLTSSELVWIFAGGILSCLTLSFLIQFFLLIKKEIRCYFAVPLFWLAFWTLVNSAGYLIIGGLAPFGDIYELLNRGILTRSLSLVFGLMIFALGFVALSWILRRMLVEFFTGKNASFGVFVFWFIIPLLVLAMLANPERGLQVAYFPLTFIPVVLSFCIEYFLVLSKQETNANPDDVSHE